MNLDKKVVVDDFGDYKYLASPKGRNIARRIQKYKRHLFLLYTIITVLSAITGGLLTYILNILKGG